jgi:hypothetical protein
VALLNLEEARGAYEEAVGLGHREAVSSARLCVLAVLSENWEDAHAHAKSAHEDGTFFNPLLSVYLTTRSRRWCGEGTNDSPEKRPVILPNARRQTGGTG